LECRIDIKRVPENDDIDHKSEGSKLVFLPFSLAATSSQRAAHQHPDLSQTVRLPSMWDLGSWRCRSSDCVRQIFTERVASVLNEFFIVPWFIPFANGGSSFTRTASR
jgi:hypothetical protein